jgi:hypothetical protein
MLYVGVGDCVVAVVEMMSQHIIIKTSIVVSSESFCR